jgi:hypothetical protein
MSREIVNKPHLTPNPDGPHTGASTHGSDAGSPSVPVSPNEAVADEPRHDSYFDEMNVTLSQAAVQPDQALKSKSSSETIPRYSAEIEPVSAFLQEQGTQPGTAEIFRDFGTQIADVPEPAAPGEASSSLFEISSSPESIFERTLIQTTEANAGRTRAQSAGGSTSDDDQLAESRIPWALLLLMSYSSAVTLALTWFVWTGRSFRSAGSPSTNSSPADVEAVPKAISSGPSGALPPLPAENLAVLGQTIQIGDLEVAPLAIELRPVVLVRSIDRNHSRREKASSLILRLKLKNVSKEHEFAPLERRFLREQTIAFDRSMIVTSPGKVLDLFPLAVESEWSIKGQSFATLKPGETMETVIASEPGIAGRLTDEMTWRVRVRIGTYRRDVLGVRFSEIDVQDRPELSDGRWDLSWLAPWGFVITIHRFMVTEFSCCRPA